MHDHKKMEFVTTYFLDHNQVVFFQHIHQMSIGNMINYIQKKIKYIFFVLPTILSPAFLRIKFGRKLSPKRKK